MPEEISFSQWLRRRREALDLTREELAGSVGCSVEMIRKIEAGVRRPSKQVAERLASSLQIPHEQHTAFLVLARAMPQVSEQERSNGHTPADETPPHTSPQNNLPAQLTPLIGREKTVAEITQSLLEGVRLLTLTGPPGIGKTRLAIEVATTFLSNPKSKIQNPEFNDGVFFVPLATIQDPGMVIPTIGQTPGTPWALGGTRRPTLDDLVEALRDKCMLLLLDNFEQVISAAPFLTDLLGMCPRLTLLVTSRETLRVRGEHHLEVEPLSYPAFSSPPGTSEIHHYSAIALLVERAREAKPDFILTDEEMPILAAICRYLEGMPLAIELVAARIKMLPPAMILERLTGDAGYEGLHAKPGFPAKARENRLQLLTGGSRDLPARHRTLRDAITWSYELLDGGEQTLFTRLGVFANGCTLSAIDAICNAKGDLPGRTLDLAASLLDKSLLKREEPQAGNTGEPHFTMLETIRVYAAERLAASGERERLQALHAEYYLALAEAADAQLTGAAQDRWLNMLAHAHPDLRAALNWATANKETDIAARLCVALCRFWEVRGHVSEGRDWLERVLEQGQDFPLALKAKVMNTIGTLALTQGDYDRAASVLAESLEIERELGDKPGTARTLNSLGLLALDQGDFEKATAILEEGLALRQELGGQWGIAAAYGNLGLTYLYRGNFGKASELFRQSLLLRQELGDKRGIAASLLNLGEVARQEANYAVAYEQYAEALRVLYELESSIDIVVNLACLASVSADTGQMERAAILFGAEEALREETGATMAPADQAEYERYVAAISAALGPVTFASAWQKGRATPLKSIVLSVLA